MIIIQVPGSARSHNYSSIFHAKSRSGHKSRSEPVDSLGYSADPIILCTQYDDDDDNDDDDDDDDNDDEWQSEMIITVIGRIRNAQNCGPLHTDSLFTGDVHPSKTRSGNSTGIKVKYSLPRQIATTLLNWAR